MMQFAQHNVDLGQPRIMGVLNVTPDSFSDGGLFLDPGQALDRALQMVEEGADFIDVGGESTRPGASGVTVEDELRRVVPVIARLAKVLPVPISVDTSKPEVMQAACDAGAAMINDVRALRAPGAITVAVNAAVPVCIMHMQGEPRVMQLNPHYDDVIAEIREFFRQRVLACEALGLGRDRIILDPGFGFGKTLEHNIRLLRQLGQLAEDGLPLLVGMSRKSMLAQMLGEDRPPVERVHASVAAHLLAIQAGASIVRVHDVAAMRDALKIMGAVRQ